MCGQPRFVFEKLSALKSVNRIELDIHPPEVYNIPHKLMIERSKREIPALKRAAGGGNAAEGNMLNGFMRAARKRYRK